jgi:rhodanese-related sulfurtransferase
MKLKRQILGLLALLVMIAPAHAIDPASVPKAKQTKLGKYLSAQEAERFVTENGKTTLFLDVRTPSEVTFLGMPTQADANVPYMVEPDIPVWDASKNNLKLEPNTDFIPEVRRRLKEKGLNENSPVVLICRSGDRSAASANLLSEAGFTNVYSVVEGFEGDLASSGPKEGQRSVNGWKNAGMPWSYKLDKSKMYKIEN